MKLVALIGAIILAVAGTGLQSSDAAPPAKPSIAFSANPVSIGAAYAVTGSDFIPGRAVVIQAWTGDGTFNCETVVNPAGSFTCNFVAVESFGVATLGGGSIRDHGAYGGKGYITWGDNESPHLAFQSVLPCNGPSPCWERVDYKNLTVLP